MTLFLEHIHLKNFHFALSENKKITDILDEGQAFEDIPIIRNDKYKASVTIMNGCNNFCTYCIVPYVRGREKSREPQNIINEIEELAKNGYKKVESHKILSMKLKNLQKMDIRK